MGRNRRNNYINKNLKITFNPALARGLSYYTGPIYEVFLKKSEIKNSVAGGGRYDNMIKDFLGKGEYPTTGISFGLDVIMEEMKTKEKREKKIVTEVLINQKKNLK